MKSLKFLLIAPIWTVTVQRVAAKKPPKMKTAQILFPGIAAVDYEEKQSMNVFVNLIESTKTQVPYQFYSLPYCKRHAHVKDVRIGASLGSKLQGADVKPAPFDVTLLEDNQCAITCQQVIEPQKQIFLRKLIKAQYRVHLYLDGLPVMMKSDEYDYAVRGYPVGFVGPPDFTGLETEEYFLYNHIRIIISYNKYSDPEDLMTDKYNIVGFNVLPVSIKHEVEGTWKEGDPAGNTLKTCTKDRPAENSKDTFLMLPSDPKKEDKAMEIIYTHDIIWQESDLQWSERWDIYTVGNPDDEIHYFAIVNSLMIVLFLTAAVGLIVLRTIKKDISAYNEMQSLEEPQEEGGWKLVHGDVFRPPTKFKTLLAVAVGTGAQIGTAIVSAMILAVANILNPRLKGRLLTSIIVLYVLSGSVSGYCSSRLYKFFNGKNWKRNTLYTACAFPGLLVIMFLFLNTFLGVAGAATHVTFLTVIAIFLLWICISTPLVFIGSYFGYRRDKIEIPVKTNQIARVVPEQVWYTQPFFSVPLGGVLPFGSVCIELFFIMSALWLHQIYYVFGFLSAVLLILAITCAEISIVMTYFQLCGEDHQWWWRSFFNCASSGMYLFFYSLWFLSSKMELVGILPTLVYFTYMSMICLSFSLFAGSIGFFSSFWFCKKIYGAIKVD